MKPSEPKPFLDRWTVHQAAKTRLGTAISDSADLCTALMALPFGVPCRVRAP